MFPAQWVCRSCLRALAQPRNRQFIRRANTQAAVASNSRDAATDLPPVLLKRARNLAAEHDRLSDVLANDFDSKTAKRAGELSRVASALREWEAAQASIRELTAMSNAADEDAELRALAREELASTQQSLSPLAESLSATLTPRDPFADLPCLLEVRPGPGGLEGRYFADAVFRMYRQYCARHGLRTKVVKYELTDAGDTTGGSGSESPLAEALLEIQDEGAYDRFRGEAGMHRVQRVPATENKGRTHTSAVAVWVLPAFPENGDSITDVNDPESLFFIDPKEVRSEKMRASGAGGQHVNKTESAIRLTHEPTGITVSMQDSRSQHANREAAWVLLRSRLAARRREEREERARSLRNNVLSRDKITRGDKIRTYNYSQDRCTDHRGGLDVHNLPDVLEGGPMLDRIMDSSQQWLVKGDIEALIAEEEAAAAAKAESDGTASKK